MIIKNGRCSVTSNDNIEHQTKCVTQLSILVEILGMDQALGTFRCRTKPHYVSRWLTELAVMKSETALQCVDMEYLQEAEKCSTCVEHSANNKSHCHSLKWVV